MNRRQRRQAKNKRGLHKPKEGKTLLLVHGTQKWKHFVQTFRDSDKRIVHTQLVTW